MNAEIMTLKTELCDFLLSLKERNDFDVRNEDSAFKNALEACHRGWILAKELHGQQGETLALHIFHLSETGYRIVEAYERTKAEAKPSAKVRRAGKYLGLTLREWLICFGGAVLSKLADKLIDLLF